MLNRLDPLPRQCALNERIVTDHDHEHTLGKLRAGQRGTRDCHAKGLHRCGEAESLVPRGGQEESAPQEAARVGRRTTRRVDRRLLGQGLAALEGDRGLAEGDRTGRHVKYEVGVHTRDTDGDRVGVHRRPGTRCRYDWKWRFGSTEKDERDEAECRAELRPRARAPGMTTVADSDTRHAEIARALGAE